MPVIFKSADLSLPVTLFWHAVVLNVTLHSLGREVKGGASRFIDNQRISSVLLLLCVCVIIVFGRVLQHT